MFWVKQNRYLVSDIPEGRQDTQSKRPEFPTHSSVLRAKRQPFLPCLYDVQWSSSSLKFDNESKGPQSLDFEGAVHTCIRNPRHREYWPLQYLILPFFFFSIISSLYSIETLCKCTLTQLILHKLRKVFFCNAIIKFDSDILGSIL